MTSTASTGAVLHLCKACAALLPTPTEDVVECIQCGLMTSWADAPDAVFERLTRSQPTEQPDWVYHARKRAAGRKPLDSNATVEEPCPKCLHPLARFYTMQLRSVDEGSTVFYECAKCKHTWTQDN